MTEDRGQSTGKQRKGTASAKKLWIAIGILAFLAPLGLVLPALFGAGGAWGEWSLREIENILGFVPEGMKRYAERWKAPLPGYSVPAQGKGLLGESIGYFLAAVIGVLATAGAGYLLAKFLSRKDRKN